MTNRMIEQKNRSVVLSKLLFLNCILTDPFKMRTLKLQTDDGLGMYHEQRPYQKVIKFIIR